MGLISRVSSRTYRGDNVEQRLGRLVQQHPLCLPHGFHGDADRSSGTTVQIDGRWIIDSGLRKSFLLISPLATDFGLLVSRRQFSLGDKFVHFYNYGQALSKGTF